MIPNILLDCTFLMGASSKKAMIREYYNKCNWTIRK